MRIVVGMTGATGAPLAVRTLQALRDLGVETHLICSRWAETTLKLETQLSLPDLHRLAATVHRLDNLAASVASGSYRTDGMVIVPCSMKTMAAIRMGLSDNLIVRAADVTLKERRPLVLVVREAPLHELHLENMQALARAGAVIFPPVLGFYHRPRTLDDVIDHIVGRILDQFGLSMPVPRWGEPSSQRDAADESPLL
ncbi:UbiX family flavin prenyltransferase [Alicyclobacillus mali]|uniref:Flavin prenyltransferase UbiX n=1 Tax=Alicyclobacillus mali (ex Roth et al. 2021) TaxID=1123961 RepID=A0ABS0F2W6_9BACL|nr:UbiX family flavin prenyltransferase [Alicyclobacillus mali (ex Roth et al. 2021)]MBF8377628.1 UbiX family flavin prenyltransferase [Alicyclobacillus mali (ex Roth et al. 2021)]MCL6487836.1 UbiX family flavin prenyltransferase [Alicyclobacillus mali (ex Roth et al. 2021)]